MMKSFDERLISAIQSKNSAVVVGLDPDVSLMPKWFVNNFPEQNCALILAYNKIVLDAVADLIPIVKPQSAFYEMYGVAGIDALEKTIEYAKSKGLLVLLDVKRGDIGSTSKAYAHAYLSGEHSGMKVDAITLNPYLGPEGLEPFVKVASENGGGLFVCGMTSNPGAKILQHLVADGLPIYRHVARMVSEFSRQTVGSTTYSSIGIVAGATYPKEAAELRQDLPNSFFLVPGMGAQGGDTETLNSFFDPAGLGALVSSSRGIMYPPCVDESIKGLSASIRQATIELNEAVNRARGVLI